MTGQIAQPFFVLTLTRSGSTWLLSLLNGQDGIVAYEELFLAEEVKEKYAWVASGSPDRFFVRRRDLAGPRARKLWRYLDEVERSRPADRPMVGFKLMLGQLRDVPELLPILALRRYRMIVLVRANLFEGAVSRVRLELTGDAQSRKAAEPTCLELPARRLVAEMQKRQRGIRILEGLHRLWPAPSTVVRYDDLLSDRPATLERALRTLGSEADAKSVDSPLKRRSERPYRELIANYDEICDAVRRAGFGSELPADVR